MKISSILCLLAPISLIIFSVVCTTQQVFAQQATSSCTQLKSANLKFGVNDFSAANEVFILQKFLKSKGYLAISPTGFYGNMTVMAVKKFQSANGISQTGIAGPITRTKISMLSCGSSVISTLTSASTTPQQQTSSIVTSSKGDLVVIEVNAVAFTGNLSVNTRSGYVYAKIKNNGKSQIYVPSTTKVTLYKNGTASNNILPNGEMITGGYSLFPGETKEVKKDFITDRSSAVGFVGTYTLYGVVDTDNVVAEDNETNNTFSRSMSEEYSLDNNDTQSIARIVGRPGLSVVNAICPDELIKIGGSTTCQVTVTNTGSIDVNVPFSITSYERVGDPIQQSAPAKVPFKVGESMTVAVPVVFVSSISGLKYITFGISEIQADIMQGNWQNKSFVKDITVADISMTDNLACPQSLERNGVTISLNPCSVDIQMIDGQGDKPFMVDIVPSVLGTSFGFTVYGTGQGLPNYAIMGGVSGASSITETLNLRANDSVLSSNGNQPRIYQGYLPITFDGQKLFVNIKIKVNPAGN